MDKCNCKKKASDMTKVIVVVDGHLVRTPDGRVWSNRIYDYAFFARYLDVFEQVRIAIRIVDAEDNQGFPNLCSGPGIEFFPIEEFRGPKEFIRKFLVIKKNMKTYFDGCDCAIFRIPSPVGFSFMHEFKKIKKPYAVEVVIDAWDSLSKNTVKTGLRPIIRCIYTMELKAACRHANGVSYVTKGALQKRYPSYASIYGESKEYFEASYSSVNLPDTYYAEPRTYKDKHYFIITHVANSISNYVKGHKELISAIALLKKRGLLVNVEFVGDGSLVNELKEFADKNDVGEQVRFIGALSNKELVREQLLKCDMFVLPSHAEGLPRCLLEAMAVGLPCIATNINGIPELLEKDCLIEIGDVQELAVKIEHFIKNPDLMERASKVNIEIAREYSEKKLQQKRIIFFKKLKTLICS